MQDVNIGQYAMFPVLMVALQLVYAVMGDTLGNRAKPLIAIGIGMFLGLVALVRLEVPFTAPLVIDYLAYGFMSGAAAVGLYESQKAVRGK